MQTGCIIYNVLRQVVVAFITSLYLTCLVQGKRIGVISSIASNPLNDAEVNTRFAAALDDMRAAGSLLPLLGCCL